MAIFSAPETTPPPVKWVPSHFPEDKAAEKRRWPPTSLQSLVRVWVQLYLCLESVPPWHITGQLYLSLAFGYSEQCILKSLSAGRQDILFYFSHTLSKRLIKKPCIHNCHYNHHCNTRSDFLTATLMKMWAGMAQSVQELAASWTVRRSNSGRCEIFHTRPDRPYGSPSLPFNEHKVPFQAVKLPGRGVDYPPPSCAEVKERVELFLYSPLGLHSLF